DKAIYEEKNMSLTLDVRKLSEAMLTALFPSHPYGTQTVLGTQEQLKNPSITNVKNYHKQWYVPNNMAICLSGDFDPDEMVDVITKYFGHLKPNPALPVLEIKPEQPITTPIEREVFGPEAERIYLAWRIPAAAHDDMPALEVLRQVLDNGNCGLIDIDINLAQTMLGAGAGLYSMADQGALMIIGMPKPGQTLDQVRELLMAEVQKLLDGEFDENLVKAIAANEKLNQQRALESNELRADIYVDAFVNGETLADVVKNFDAYDNITKDDVLAAARRYLGTNNYAAIYKRQGEDTTLVKLPKPELTPIATNRDASSAFLQEIKDSKVEPIEPVFVDFDRDITRLTAKQDAEVLYTHNNSNDLFSLTYIYDKGTGHDLNLSMADVLSIAGTRNMTPEQVARAFYDLACSYRVVPGTRRTYVVLEGLSENMLKAMNLYETLIEEATVAPEAWNSLMDRMQQSRANAKSNQSQNFGRLSQYAMYGPRNSANTVLDIDSLRAAGPDGVLQSIRDLRDLKYRTIYYGTHTPDQVTEAINDIHVTGEELADAPTENPYPLQLTPETIVLVAPYDAKQLYMRMVSNRGEKFNPADMPTVALYNEYFGGGMNSIVFQEMRESRSLAYSAGAFMSSPSRLDDPYIYATMIATQNDKMANAIEAFDDIINNMPRSESAFQLAKQGLDSRLRTERTIKDNIAWAYINARDLGLDTDRRRTIFENVPALTLDDIEAYQKANVADRTYVYAILGDIADLDMAALEKLGRVVILTTEDIFGY
ncbi:MAG: insulinase family protein, partial [Muribaculaceae bacterium]|nr:insulinase family protein [Muribaculaceae bacterium]